MLALLGPVANADARHRSPLESRRLVTHRQSRRRFRAEEETTRRGSKVKSKVAAHRRKALDLMVGSSGPGKIQPEALTSFHEASMLTFTNHQHA